MNSEAIPTKILDIARKAVGAKNVWRAIDLIEYDNKLDPAMKFIFGGVLVCTDLNTANKVRYFFDRESDVAVHKVSKLQLFWSRFFKFMKKYEFDSQFNSLTKMNLIHGIA